MATSPRTLWIPFFLLLFTSVPSEAEETWLLSVDRWGNTEYQTATWTRDGAVLQGEMASWPLEGRLEGEQIEFTATDRFGEPHRFRGILRGDRAQGMAEYPSTNDPSVREEHAFKARKLPRRPEGPHGARRVFEPTDYSNVFTADREPVMVLWPGDTLVTRTIDSGGVDHDGITQALYGNPQTGPFFIADARPGDVLAVHIRRLDLSRDYADSLNGLVSRAMTSRVAAQASELGRRVRWQLDREAGLARLENPPAGLESYRVPLRPMLGGLGVAPDFGYPPASAGDTGRFGGNMDFREITAGSTVYLPVYQPGALLYLGDGHALQGDGETTQWALETSLDVELSVEVLPARPLSTPRVETDTHLITLGQSGSLDRALQSATSGMIQWLAQDFGLDVEASSLILGTAAEYRVSTLAGRNAGMALKLPKKLLEPLRPEAPRLPSAHH